MNFNFKDTEIEKLFKKGFIDDEETNDIDYIDDDFNSNEIAVSSSLSFTSLETLLGQEVQVNSKNRQNKKEDTQVKKKIQLENKILFREDNLIVTRLNQIEMTQNSILEILKSLPSLNEYRTKKSKITVKDEEILKLNLQLFNERLIILSTKSENQYVSNLLLTLEEISEHLSSNSFHVFTQKNSLVMKALHEIDIVGMGDSLLNSTVMQTEELLKDIHLISKVTVFEQSYKYGNLLLEKGMLLNSITLLNEATGMYIIESIKGYSKEIQKYTYLRGEENPAKLYSRAKDFFYNIFAKKEKEFKPIPLFPHHIIVKNIDKEIHRKFINIHKTWENKGDGGLFLKYAYIIHRIRYIRNSVAHADMETSFKSLKSELKVLNDDFYYMAVKKNILKR